MSEKQVVTQTKQKSENTQSIEMLLAQLESGSGIANKLNDLHIDKLIAQRGEIIEKVHADRKGERWDNKFYITAGLIFAALVLGGVMFFLPEYFPEAMTALVSGGGGLGAGYGLAKK